MDCKSLLPDWMKNTAKKLPTSPSYKKWLHFQNRSREEREGSKYCSTTLKSNKNALLFHIIFSRTVSKCITIISKSIFTKFIITNLLIYY